MLEKKETVNQYVESRCEHGVPERRLLAAVLETAIGDATRAWQAAHREDAVEWIWNDKSFEPMSFAWVCEGLSLCPNTLRRVIREHMQAERPLMVQKHGMTNRKIA
jgi:hypothetical protein